MEETDGPRRGGRRTHRLQPILVDLLRQSPEGDDAAACRLAEPGAQHRPEGIVVDQSSVEPACNRHRVSGDDGRRGAIPSPARSLRARHRCRGSRRSARSSRRARNCRRRRRCFRPTPRAARSRDDVPPDTARRSRSARSRGRDRRPSCASPWMPVRGRASPGRHAADRAHRHSASSARPPCRRPPRAFRQSACRNRHDRGSRRYAPRPPSQAATRPACARYRPRCAWPSPLLGHRALRRCRAPRR